MTTVGEYTKGFPNALSKITGTPSYEALQELRNLTRQNALSVPSHLGGGIHGHLGLVLSAPRYFIIAPGTPFNIPDRPDALPMIPLGSTAAQTAELVRQHSEQVRIWTEANNVHTALKNTVVAAIEAPFLRALRHRTTGYINVALSAIFAHLFTVYGRITPQQLTANDAALNKPWDPTTPFEILIDRIEDCIDFATDGGAPSTDAQILNSAYTLVFNTGLYFDDTKTWNRRPAIEKTWENFKIHFLQAQLDLQAQQMTTQQGGFANRATEHNDHLQNQMLHQTSEALANLANANATDREMYSQLVTNNSKLTDQLERALAEISKLTTTLRTHSGSVSTPPTFPPPNSQRPFKPKSYCWTHGYNVSKTHNSTNCKSPAIGHQKNSTVENNMGGNQIGSPPT
jgi:hypothetical protein